MMKALLLFLLLTMPLFVFSQRPGSEALVPSTPQPLTVPMAKVINDTLFPPALFQSCADTVNSFGLRDTTRGLDGFIVGSNNLFDILKIQRFIYESDEPFAVTEVGVAFAAADPQIRDRTVSVELYDNLGPDSLVGDQLAISDSIAIRDINLPDRSIRFTRFTFPNPVVQPSDTFLVAVNFEDTYADFADSTGYVAVFHTYPDCNDPGVSTFETYFDNQDEYVTVPLTENYSNFDVEFVMYVAVTTDINTSTRSPVAEYHASVFPNPASDQVSVRFSAPGASPFAASLTDITGRTLMQRQFTSVAGANTINWQVSDLPAGLYLFHVDGPEGRQSGKVMIH